MSLSLLGIVLLGIFASSLAATPALISTSRRTAVVVAIEQVQPAVVSIHAKYRDHVVYQRHPFWDFFVLPHAVPGRTMTGSGLIVTQDGYVLTNDHVFGTQRDRLEKIEVSLMDGRVLDAQFVGSDVSFDLVALKIDGTGFPVAPLGDSDDILVGEWAIAIGNPFDLGPTVSIGVVSAAERDFHEPQGDYYYRDMIQTDASINPGNSGGPLVNAVGEVMGINSFIYSGSEYSIGSIGIGFAIPINSARRFLDEVAQYGKVREPWSGIVYLQDLNEALAEAIGLTSSQGALVVKVAANSPAYDAGLEKGDVIIAVSGQPVGSADQAIAAFREYRVDEECILSIVREGISLEIDLRFAEWPRARRRWH